LAGRLTRPFLELADHGNLIRRARYRGEWLRLGGTMRHFALKTFAALIIVECASFSVNAQDNAAARDETTLKFLRDEAKAADGSGLVFVGTTIFQNTLVSSKERCAATQISVGRVVDGKYRPMPSIQGRYKLLGEPKNYAPVAMKAGQYLVGSVTCQQSYFTSGGTTFRGPYARFHVKTGELLDVGSLTLEYQSGNFFSGSGKARTGVESTDPERLGEMKKAMPVAMKKLLNRPMVLIEPTETRGETIWATLELRRQFTLSLRCPLVHRFGKAVNT
jgi:hypothetical protein